jgi:hypothetical protein
VCSSRRYVRTSPSLDQNQARECWRRRERFEPARFLHCDVDYPLRGGNPWRMAWVRAIVVAGVVGSRIGCGGHLSQPRLLDRLLVWSWPRAKYFRPRRRTGGPERRLLFPDVTMTFRIVHTPSSPTSDVAAFRVESVQKWHLPNGKQPRIGQRGQLRLRYGVITDSITGATFCAPNIDRCGA